MNLAHDPDPPESYWNRLTHPVRRSPWPRRLAATLAVVVVAPLVHAMPASAAPRSAPAVQRETPVLGKRVPVLPRTADPAERQAWKTPPGVVWPKPQAVELDATGGTGARTLSADFPVRIVPPKKPSKATESAKAAETKTTETKTTETAKAEDGKAGEEVAAATPDKVRVELLDTASSGLLGLALRVTAGQSQGQSLAAAKGRTRLEIDYSGFRYAFGGDYGARLRLVKLGECALTAAAPAAADRTAAPAAVTACPQPEPMPSDNDAKNGTLSADVDMPALYALQAAPSGPSGDHTATSLAPSAEWSVGTQSGDFSWGYDLRAPPALGGDEPEMSLAYSSQSVDGRTVSTNNQPSWAGEGFELNPSGYIERRYKSCMIDGKKTGDLCWDQENAVMSLGDSSVELVKDATTKQWRPRRDDGTRVEHLTGAVNGDDNGEYWRVTTDDGTQYTFGLNRLPGWASGKPETGSAWTVPVFGNNSGEPCHTSDAASSWCRQAYRWNLDLAVDTHGNATTYWYGAEKNFYGRNMKPEQGTEYVRGGYLKRIDYGYLRNELFTRSPASRVVFDVAERCVCGRSGISPGRRPA